MHEESRTGVYCIYWQTNCGKCQTNSAVLFGSMWCLYLPNYSFFTLWIVFLIPGGAHLTKWKPTSLGFIQLRISQVLRRHKDLLSYLFSSSAVQIENHSGQFEPKKTFIVWTRPNPLTVFAPYGAWTKKSRKSKWVSFTVNRSSKCPTRQWSLWSQESDGQFMFPYQLLY